VVKFDQPPQERPLQGEVDKAMPKDTTRHYVRESVSTGGTDKARQQVLMQQLYAGNSAANTDQQAAAIRGRR